MGLKIDQTSFGAQQYQAFSKRLTGNLDTLKAMLESAHFSQGNASFGAELELYILDQHHQPLCINKTLMEQAQLPQLQLELNQYNLELNLTPTRASGCPFSTIESETGQLLGQLSAIASTHNARVVPIGVMPTLREQDLDASMISDFTRYHALSSALRSRRGDSFPIHIEGEDTLTLNCEDVTLGGANTSFQFHWRVNSQNFYHP